MTADQIKKLTQKEIEKMTIAQGRQILQLMTLPGWKVIESILTFGKNIIEQEGINAARSNLNKERCIFFTGEMSGYSTASANIHSAVARAKVLEETKDAQKGWEEQ